MEGQLERVLHKTLYRFDCPAPEALRDYYWDDLATGDRAQLERHLATCLHCTDDLAELQTLMAVDDITAAITVDADDGVAHRTFDPSGFVDDITEQIQRAAEQIRYVIATLVAPTAPAMASIALRSAKTTPMLLSEDVASLTFEAEDTTISLILQHEPDGSLRLAGQVLALDEIGNGMVKLTPEDDRKVDNSKVVEVPINEIGNFFLQQLQSGNFQLTVFLDATTIIIPRLRIA